MMMPVLSLTKYLLNTNSKDKWKRIGTRKRDGVLVPLFSIYSKKSLGVGEFADLRLLIDWANVTGNSIIQLLPMNEVGSLFCPYDSMSSFALEPAYISFELIPAARDKTIVTKIENLRKVFSCNKPYVDYAIKREKIQLLKEIYRLEKKRDSAELRIFKEENDYWLGDFALFKVLKDFHQGQAWYLWEDRFRNRRREALEEFSRQYKQEIAFQVWLQWLLYQQFKSVKDYAEKKKVLLKGDLPFLVSRDSADVWVHPEFFKLDFASGAPPDMYCAKGQRWGMPTYNWERVADDDYRYLKEKLSYAGEFYDILRIDHVVGLFRIWSIPYNEPLENQGLNGFFDPKDEHKWLEYGRKILKVILDNTDMLLCAEDLGVIPKVCTDTLKELGIPGNDVQRWVKDYKMRHDFLSAQEYRALSVAMLSTHDTSDWPAWWENEAGTVDEALVIRKCSDHRRINFGAVKDKLFDAAGSKHGRLRWSEEIDSVEKLIAILGKRKEELADFIDMYNNTYHEKEKLWKQLGLAGEMREKSGAEIVRLALKISLNSSAIFCINTLIDWLYLADVFSADPYQYRINTPGTISDKNWSLRIPIFLEDLLKLKINKDIRQMIAASGRI
jgi:4-alpha-glucanotransferase